MRIPSATDRPGVASPYEDKTLLVIVDGIDLADFDARRKLARLYPRVSE